MAQVALADNGAGQVTGEVVRLLELSLLSDDVEDSQAEGMVVDRDLGFLYVGMENGPRVIKFAAEPDGGDDDLGELDNSMLYPDVEGLTIAYEEGDAGYILVSSQGDHTFSAYARGDNAYLGSFVVAGTGDIDQTNESDGADVLAAPIGSIYPQGLLVVQDGANDPQVIAEDDGELENTSANFKFVSWGDVLAAMNLK